MHYRHTQTGWVILGSMGAAAVLSVVGLSLSGKALLGGAFGALFLLCAALFGWLRTEVDADEIRLTLGVGLLRRRMARKEITEARRVRNAWYYGWGIRKIRNGWMWNVSGLDAVELLRGGGRAFRIGTDDPEGLLAALGRGS